MADKKISALTSASTPLAGTEVLPIVQSGATVKVAVSDLTAGRAVSALTLTTTGTITSGSYLSVQKSGTTYAYVGSAGDIVSGGANADMALSTPGVNNMVFAIANNEKWRLDTTGNLVVKNSGNGIDFSATSGSGTSELFSDYEEGTWTPALARATTAPTVTYSAQTGYYTKVGRLVTVTIAIIWTANSGGSGTWRISGLPFTTSNDTNNYSTGAVVDYTGVTLPIGTTQLGVETVRGNTSMDLYASGSAVSSAAVSTLANAGSMFFTMTYSV